jgi:pyridinium-3,5-biscarboxylic acid mononucleotide synthase
VIPERARAILERVAVGEVTPAEAVAQLAMEPMESLGYATVDHHRALRQGYPEVVFGAGKTPEQIVGITEQLAARGDGFLVTRTDPAARSALATRFPQARVNDVARTVCLVAEEAAETALALGCPPRRVTDVGVAGIHRILARSSELRESRVIIVVAGMDGALPSVVGGLAACPVIAVPTSVGYGAAFGGIAPLLTALNSCSAGVTVVNIDNGFGAAMAASRILGIA